MVRRCLVVIVTNSNEEFFLIKNDELSQLRENYLLAMEVAEKQANTFRNAPADGEINYVRPQHPREPSK